MNKYNNPSYTCVYIYIYRERERETVSPNLVAVDSDNLFSAEAQTEIGTFHCHLASLFSLPTTYA
jgi:hypothetical protein